MLSFDISDKKIRVVKGELSGGKIKIVDTITIDIPQGIIINGFIQELTKLVSIISERLRDKRFFDKEAVVCLSSSQVVFREINVPKAKGAQLSSMVQNRVKSDMGINDDYNISFTVVGEAKEGNSVVNKVLAIACPNEIVLGIKRLFNMLSLPIKSVSVSCNCISRIVLSDNRNKDRMPLLVIQIEDDFLNLNLYEKNQLVFSKVVSIEKDDYNSEDYIYEALNENVFRMIQFNRARDGEGIRDIVFYGDVSDYIKLTRSIEQQDVRTHILAVPNQVSGYEKFEFTDFANAIGAMFKNKKETEKTNLLELDYKYEKEKVTGEFYKTLISVFVLCVAIVVAGFIVLGTYEKSQDKELNRINSDIEANQSELLETKQKENQLAQIKGYVDGVIQANNALTSNKILNSDIFNTIRNCMGNTGKILGTDYSSGVLTLTISATSKEAPANIVEKLTKTERFENIGYEGFKIISSNNVEFVIAIVLKAGDVE